MAEVSVQGTYDFNFNTPDPPLRFSSSNTGFTVYTNGSESLSISFDGGRGGPATSVTLAQNGPSGTAAASVTVTMRGLGLSDTDILRAAGTNVESVLPFVLRGNDTVTGGGNLYGGDGNDVFNMVGPLGGTVDGGTGLNTLQVDPNLTVKQIGQSRFTLSGTTAAGNVSIAATDIQRIKAGNDVTAFDISGDAGQAYRLYQAALDRAPDTAGLSNQVNALDHGVSLHDLAAGFLNSAEFGQRYGTNLSNQDFVTALYRNTLHRAPDAAGQANWVNALNAGVIDRATALVGFSESQENHLNTDRVLVTGIHLDADYLTFG